MSGAPLRLWFQKHTVQGRLPELDEMYRRHVQAVLPHGVEVTFATLPAAVYEADLPEGLVRYGALESLFAGYFAAAAVRAERDGYDAYIIGTSQDPGLREARSLAGIPVLGYGETSFHLAALRGTRFGVVGFIPELARPITENVERCGLSHLLVGVEPMDLPPDGMVAAIRGDDAAFHAAFAGAAATLVERGAEAIIPGEGLPNEVLVRSGVRTVHGAAVLDPDGAVLLTAELLARAGRLGVLPAPTVGYWHRRPPQATLDHLVGLLAPAVVDPAEQVARP